LNFPLNIADITLAHPWFLLLLPVAIVLQILIAKTKNKVALQVSNLQTLPNIKSGWKTKFSFVPNLLKTLGLCLAIIALARPQLTNTFTQTEGDGVDVVLSIDISGSMLAQDFDPNRLDAAKDVATKFVTARPYDNIGLVIFSGESFSMCPLTTDHRLLTQSIQNIRSGMIASGTAIGMGLATAVDRVRNSKAKSKVVVLLTDGVDNCIDCPIAPRTALDIALALGVKVYTIGVGTKGLAYAPSNQQDAFGNWIFAMQEVIIDEALLTEIANKTGGKYYRATDTKALQQIFTEIDKLEKSKLKIKTHKQVKELYYGVLLIAFVLLTLAFVLDRTLLKKFP
jgi:Ca-activated chloride channel homolog